MIQTTSTDHDELLAMVIDLARQGGELARDRRQHMIVASKNGDVRDVVTNIDIEISQHLVAIIEKKFPDHDIYSEESHRSETASDWLWAIDPIDGTSNYVRGLPHYSCVVTVLYRGDVYATAVYAPMLQECYWLDAGAAYCNGDKLQPAQVTELSAAYVNFHPGRKEMYRQWASDTLHTLLGSARKSMNLGSSALDLCYVAAGKTDVLVYGSLSTLDVAGAVALVRAVGGEVYQYGTTDPVQFTKESQRLIAITNQALLHDVYDKLQ